jgi:hypothetical protein
VSAILPMFTFEKFKQEVSSYSKKELETAIKTAEREVKFLEIAISYLDAESKRLHPIYSRIYIQAIYMSLPINSCRRFISHCRYRLTVFITGSTFSKELKIIKELNQFLTNRIQENIDARTAIIQQKARRKSELDYLKDIFECSTIYQK